MRAVYRWWTGIVFAGVLIQIAFAGYGAFYTVDKADKAGETISHHGIDHGWALHSAFGTIVIGLGILLIPIAFAAKVDRERKRTSIVIGVLMVVQLFLAVAGGASAPLGFLHPLNAIAIAAVTGITARREWKGGSATAAASV
jgi:4-amino-4-deoxy-L-arabinose transferase-like glycosyltransferase